MKWKEKTDNDFYDYIDLSSLSIEKHLIQETQRINKSNAPSRAQQIVKKNDVLFGATRPMLKRYCIIPQKYDNQICSTGYCVLRANGMLVNPKWVYYQISTSNFYEYVENHQQGASYPGISDKDIKNYVIQLPSLDEQNRIIKLLDKFDKLVNDLKDGLPAEIEARKKQYEYYRNKLLSFE